MPAGSRRYKNRSRDTAAAHGLAWLRDYVEQRRLTALDDRDGPPQRWSQIPRIIDGALGVHPHALRQLGEIHIRVRKRSPDSGAVDSALVPVGHALHVHELFVIGAVIVHDAQQRNAMMRRRP